MEIVNYSKDVICVAVYMDRDRGVVASGNAFVVFRDSRGVNWYSEPLNKCATPDALMLVHSIKDKDALFGGQLTRRTLDANFLRVSLDGFHKLIVAAFRVEQPHARSLPFFVDAEVCINSLPSGVGSIRDLIKNSPWGF